MKICVINGPNLNMLGIRQKEIYGEDTYEDLCLYIENYCYKENIDVELFQSNFEGDIIDKIQSLYDTGVEGIVINAAAYSHTSIAILDALECVAIPTVEVHLTDIKKREEFRRKSILESYCKQSFVGLGFDGYIKAIEYLRDNV